MFLGLVSEQTLKKHLSAALQAKFGDDIKQSDRNCKVYFPVAMRFHLTEASCIVPADTSEFEMVDHLSQFLSGSKVAFRRKIVPGLTFLHTGIMLRGRNGEPVSIMEVNRELGSNEEVTTLRLKPAYEVYSRGNNPN